MALYDVYFEPLQSALFWPIWKKHQLSDYLDLALLGSHYVFNIMICKFSRNQALTLTCFAMNHFETIPYRNWLAIDGILKFLSVIFKFSQYTRSTKNYWARYKVAPEMVFVNKNKLKSLSAWFSINLTFWIHHIKHVWLEYHSLSKNTSSL